MDFIRSWIGCRGISANTDGFGTASKGIVVNTEGFGACRIHEFAGAGNADATDTFGTLSQAHTVNTDGIGMSG